MPAIRLCEALSTAGTDKDNIIIVASDGVTKFAINRKAALAHSPLIRDLMEFPDEESVESASEVPLCHEDCTPWAVQICATFVNHHRTPRQLSSLRIDPITTTSIPDDPSDRPRPAAVLTQRPSDISDWDWSLFHEHVVPDGDMVKHSAKLFELAKCADFVNIVFLRQLISAYLAFQLRVCVDTARSATGKAAGLTSTALIRKWFGLDGDFTNAELKNLLSDFRSVRNISADAYDEERRQVLERLRP